MIAGLPCFTFTVQVKSCCILACLFLSLLTCPVNAEEKQSPLNSIKDAVGGAPEGLIKKLKDNIPEKLLDQSIITREKPQKVYPIVRRDFSEHQTYDFNTDIRPILDTKCIACHACVGAPCQLNLEKGGIGLERGGSRTSIYDGTRLHDIAPTRLGIDGQTTADWRQLGFFDVLATAGQGSVENSSLLRQMIDLARSNPLQPNTRIPEDLDLSINRTLTCPAPSEFSSYAKANPHGGMPLAVSGLDDMEYQKLSTWLDEGALIEPVATPLTPKQQTMILKAEEWFNRKDDRVRLVARYLYEHLFLASLYFENPPPGEAPSFFRLIRSKTASGTDAVQVQTNRPNDDPKGAFYYRLVPINETIVHKSLVTYRFDEKRLKYYEDLFFKSDWRVTALPGYSVAEKSNPFIVFADIPATARYRFLLKDAEFFVRNFIRGPVCHGQIATSVIRDQFWVMFEGPEKEQFTNNPDFQNVASPLLGVPGQKSEIMKFGPEWVKYWETRNEYLIKRQSAYQTHFPTGASEHHVWDGDHTNTNAFLTVFRHHTNASVVRGWQGDIPLTVWWMDYPLLERTFYELVVGFDVFGGVAHQAQTRLYFDLIRNEAETNFLRLLPSDRRQQTYDHWYQGMAKIKTLTVYQKLDTETPSSIEYDPSDDDPKNLLLNRFLRHFSPALGDSDIINRCTKDCEKDTSSAEIKHINEALRTLASRPASQLPGIKWLPEVSFMRVDLPNGDYVTYGILRNRRHSNVAFIFGESLRYQEDLDTLTIVPAPVGSYPNLMLRIDFDQIEQFADDVESMKTKQDFDQMIDHWGVLRMSTDFWDTLHSFSALTRHKTPLEAGIYDVSRYGHW